MKASWAQRALRCFPDAVGQCRVRTVVRYSLNFTDACDWTRVAGMLVVRDGSVGRAARLAKGIRRAEVQ